jgi:hypothetical protein
MDVNEHKLCWIMYMVHTILLNILTMFESTPLDNVCRLAESRLLTLADLGWLELAGPWSDTFNWAIFTEKNINKKVWFGYGD